MKFGLATLLLCFALLVPAKGQLTVAPIGPCDADGVSAGVKGALEGSGYQVKDASGAPFADVWLRKDIPSAKGASAVSGSDYYAVPLSTLIGVIRFNKEATDFRGTEKIKPGVYTMRYNLQPEDGDHQGTSPRRDHLVLSPVAADQDASANPKFDDLVKLSAKIAGGNHPCVLFMGQPDTGAKFPSIEHGQGRDMLDVQSGSLQLGITLVGKAAE